MLSQRTESTRAEITILEVRLKAEFPCSMSLQYLDTIIASNVEASNNRFSFDLPLTLETQNAQLCPELLINLISDSGQCYRAGVVKLPVERLTSSIKNEILLPVDNCVDINAVCKLKIESLSKLENPSILDQLTKTSVFQNSLIRSQKSSAQPPLPEDRQTPTKLVPSILRTNSIIDNISSSKKEDRNLLVSRDDGLKRFNGQSSRSRPIRERSNFGKASRKERSRQRDHISNEKLAGSRLSENRMSPGSKEFKDHMQEDIEMAALKTRNDQLENILRNRSDTLTHLMVTMEAQREGGTNRTQLDMLAKEHATRLLEDRITELTTDNRRLKNDVTELQEKLRRSNEKYEGDMKLLKEMNSTNIIEMTKTKSMMSSTDAEKQLRSCKGEYFRLQKINGELKDKVQELEQDRLKGQEKLDDLKRQMDDMVATNCKLSSSNVKLIKDNLLYRNSMMQKDQITVEVRRDFQRCRAELQDNYDQLNEKYLKQMKKITSLNKLQESNSKAFEKTIAANEAKIKELSKELQEAQKMAREKDQKFDKYEEEMQNAHELLVHQTESAESLSKERADLKAQLAKVVEALASQKQKTKTAELQQRLMGHHQETSAEQLKADLNKLSTEFAWSCTRYEELTVKNEQVIKELFEKHQQLQEKELKLTELFAELAHQREEHFYKVSDLEQQVDQAQRKLYEFQMYKQQQNGNEDHIIIDPVSEQNVEQYIINTAIEEFKVKYLEQEEAIEELEKQLDKRTTSSEEGSQFRQMKLRDIITKQEQQINRLNGELTGWIARNEAMTEKTAYLDVQLSNMMAKNNDLLDRINCRDDQEQLVKMREQIKEMTRSISQQVEQKHGFHLQCMEYETTLRHVNEKLASYEEIVLREKTRYEEIKEIIRIKEIQLVEARTQLELVNRDNDRDNFVKDQRLRDLELEAKNHKNQLIKLDQVTNERDKYRRRIEELSEQIRNKNEQIDALSEVIAMEKDKNEYLEQASRRLNEQIEDCKQKLDSMEQREDQYEEQMAESEQQYIQLQDSLAELEAKNVDELKQLNDIWHLKYKQSTDETERALSIIEKERQYFVAKMSSLEAQYDSKEQQFLGYQAQMGDKIRIYEEKIARLELEAKKNTAEGHLDVVKALQENKNQYEQLRKEELDGKSVLQQLIAAKKTIAKLQGRLRESESETLSCIST